MTTYSKQDLLDLNQFKNFTSELSDQEFLHLMKFCKLREVIPKKYFVNDAGYSAQKEFLTSEEPVGEDLTMKKSLKFDLQDSQDLKAFNDLYVNQMISTMKAEVSITHTYDPDIHPSRGGFPQPFEPYTILQERKFNLADPEDKADFSTLYGDDEVYKVKTKGFVDLSKQEDFLMYMKNISQTNYNYTIDDLWRESIIPRKYLEFAESMDNVEYIPTRGDLPDNIEDIHREYMENNMEL